MKTFESIYNSVIRELPFSIIGYSDLDERVNNFFNNFSNHFFLRRSSKFSFLSYSFVKLEEIEDWKIDHLRHDFFFHSFKDSYTEVILSYYYYLKRLDFETEEKSEDIRLTVNFLSEYFSGDVGYRVSVNSKKVAEVSFLQSKNTIDISLPCKIFRSKKTEQIQELFHQKLFIPISKIENLDLGNKRDSNYRNLYRYEHKPETAIEVIYSNFTRKLFDYKEIRSILDDLRLQFKFFCKNNPIFFRKFYKEEEQEKFINEWVKTLISVATISLYFDSYIEYMPSICGVFQRGYNKEEKRNLGGLIVGYNIEHQISNEERALFRLIGDRVTAIIAGQYLYDKNEALRQKEHTQKVRDIFDRWLSGNPENEKSKKIREKIMHDTLINIVNDTICKELKITEKDIEDEFQSMLEELKEAECKKYLGSNFYDRFEKFKKETKILKSYFTRISNDRLDKKNPTNEYKDLIIEKYYNEYIHVSEIVNVPLLDSLLFLLLKKEDKPVKSDSIKITINKSENKESKDRIIIEAEFIKDIELDFSSKKTNGDLTVFLQENYYALLGHFNFQAYKIDNGKEEQIFDFKKHFQYGDNGRAFLNAYKPAYTVLKVRYTFENLLTNPI